MESGRAWPKNGAFREERNFQDRFKPARLLRWLMVGVIVTCSASFQLFLVASFRSERYAYHSIIFVSKKKKNLLVYGMIYASSHRPRLLDATLLVPTQIA